MLKGDLHTQLVAAGARLSAAGLVHSSEGNLSARIDRGRCLVTPTGGVTGRLTGADMVEVPLDRGKVPRRASSEVRLHIEIYRLRPDVEAIVHAHPPCVLRLAREGRLPDAGFLDEDGSRFGGVVDGAVLRRGQPGARRDRSRRPPRRRRRACFLDHGAVTVGVTVESALRRMLRLERAAARTRGR